MSRTQRSRAPAERPASHDPHHSVDEGDDVESWGHPPHVHGYGQLVHAVAGRAVVTIHDVSDRRASGPDRDDRAVSTHVVDDATALWVPPDVWHSARFEPGFCPSVHAVDLGPADVSVRTLVVDADVRAELLATHWRPDPVLTRTRRALATQQPDAASRPPWPTGPVARVVADALDLDPGDPRELDDWARLLHTSTTSIRRAFKAETGLTWTNWRTRLRLHVAVALLQAGERPSRAATAVGFSVAGLGAAVRRHHGCTPSALMRRPDRR